ncbi:MAG: preprotein translocase subunit SecE [Phycisphaerales bacterium]|nr:preprotein translocase subunit SecE [Phycisphaerales bacterium]
MALGIYKPGHGYWVRVLTAVVAGLLVLATAAWLWGETAAINLPNSAWDVSLSESEGSLAPGQVVTVLADPLDPAVAGGQIEVGTMEVATFEASELSPRVRLVKPELAEGVVPSDMKGVRAEGFSASVGESGAVFPIPVIQPLYVQGAVAGLAMLAGAVLVFVFVGSKPASCEFLIATDGEMKKVNWSTRREVMGSTWVVIAASFLVAAILYLVDYAFQTFFHAINVLQR